MILHNGNNPVCFYNKLAPIYDKQYQTSVFLAENQAVFDWLKPITEGRTIVDLGCGTGLALEYLRPHSARYIGIDAAEQMIVQARKKFPDYYFLCRDFNILSRHDLGNIKTEYLVISLFGSPSYFCDLESIIKKLVSVFPRGTSFFLMLYSKRYLEKKDYIATKKNQDITCFMYSYHDVRAIMDSMDIFSFEVFSFEKFCVGLNFIPCSILTKLLKLESKLPAFNDRGHFIIVTGKL